MGFVSLLPILIAVILALYTRQAVFALFCGLLSAALLLNWETPLHSFVYLIDPLILDAVADKDSMKVVLFSILISSTVEIMRRAGGTQALVGVFIRFAKTRRRALLGTWLSGLVIFFDDYANCLIVGSSMRSVVDRAKISREKLAYLVDSTAAPVATLALISTWIGYEVSLMDTALNQQMTIPHTSAVTAPYSSVFVSDPKHSLEQPSIRINDRPHSLQKQSYGWSAEASTQTAGRWELQIMEKNSESTPLIVQSPWENAAIGLAIQNGKTVLSDIAETGFQNQTPARIFTEKNEREGLLLEIAHRGNDVLIRDIQNNMFRATDDGIAPDTKANDGIFSVQLPMKQEDQLFFFRSASEEESALFNKAGNASIVWDAEGLRKKEVNAYTFFLAGLPYRFYPILALVFGLLIAGSGRDFGPMLEAEKKQLQKEVLVKDPDISISKLMTAIVPLLLLVCITAADLYLQGSPKVGSEAKIFEIIGAADGYDAMLKGAIFSALSVSILALLSGTPPKDVGGGFKDGATHLFEALCILVLAWALGNAISELEAATYLVQILDGAISPALLPSIVFILAAGIAFSTGTSFGTMGTLMPLALPLAIQMQLSPELCLAVGAAVLSGATWGDHCSPISDTTILSSAGADCDHIAHVKTQLPYALAAGIVSLVFCSIPIGFGLHWGPALILGSIACTAIIWIYGKTPETQVKQA